MGIFYQAAVPILKLSFGTEANNWRGLAYNSLDGCKNKTKVKEMIRDAVIPSLEDGLRCLNESRKYMCETYHSICLVDGINKTVLQSLPCKRSCLQFESICASSIKVLRDINQMKRECPKMSKINNRFFYLPDCNQFPDDDILEMEKCQMHPMKGKMFVF